MTAAYQISDLLTRGLDDAHAIAAPDRRSLNYCGLRKQAAAVASFLANVGIGRNDRVAIVLPNGPEMASAFVSVASVATTAPLNPAYTESEFEFYLKDLSAKAILVNKDDATGAADVARRLGIVVLDVAVDSDAAAGEFGLSSQFGESSELDNKALAERGDVALILHTSGTTSRPKIVPLTQENICASAENVQKSLILTPADHCLNIMPLFHIHGLIAAVLASLNAGSCITCTPGFDALKVFGWLDSAKPTWYTAVPTMHQTILSRAARNKEVIERVRLRFVRSSSASLPPTVMQDLEKTFGVPVIEAYGMTEAAHQMASNPLPPGTRKSGSVGLAAGPDVAIMNTDGELVEANQTGEIVIRGPNVSPGYENNPAANKEAYTNGWFRTGDQGLMDSENYIQITGRLKEIINRGGEKISPREVDEVILDHPEVRQVVTFAIPHPKLGEEVAAAIVLTENATVSPSEIKEFAAKRLTRFKIPKTVVLLDEIPKGPTGKLQRIGLAEKLGLT